MTCILVTGGSGFIGQHLVASLVASGRQTRVLDLRAPGRAVANAQYIKGSVLDRGLVDQSLDGVEEVYHLAGLPGMWMAHKDDFHAVNCRGTEVVISAARKRGIARMLPCSTESILFRSSPAGETGAVDTLLSADDMPGPYTRSKLLAERAKLNNTSGGSSDTELKEFTVTAIARPSRSTVVTRVTPVAKQPSASRKARELNSRAGTSITAAIPGCSGTTDNIGISPRRCSTETQGRRGSRSGHIAQKSDCASRRAHPSLAS